MRRLVLVLTVLGSALLGRLSAPEPYCVEDEYYHVQSARCVHVEDIKEDRA
jgi:hypothetical protein